VISLTRPPKFFEPLDPGRVLPEMAWARRDVPEPEPSQQLGPRALVIGDVPAGQDQPPQSPAAGQLGRYLPLPGRRISWLPHVLASRPNPGAMPPPLASFLARKKPAS
jgi:hypothetical protein